MRVSFPFFLLLLLFPLSAWGEGFSGYAEMKGLGYLARSTPSDPWGEGWGTAFGKWEGRAGETQLTAALRGEWLTTDEQGRLLDPADRRLRRPFLSVQDLWARVPLSPSWDLQFGRFQLGWGKTDGYSPADAFLPRDLTDPFADEKLPLWAIRVNGQEGSVRYEGVAVPVTTPWRLPVLGGRNAPLRVPGVPAGTEFWEVESTPPVEGFGALRLLATFGEWDVGAWGRFGTRPAPLLEFRFDQATAASGGLIVPVERRYAEEEGVGVEISRVTGAWIVRSEVAGLFSRDQGLGNALIGTLSAERAFGDGTLLITLAHNAITPPVDPELLFDRSILPALIAAWNRNEEWGAWKIVWAVGLKRGDGLVKGEVGYNLTDVWKATVGADYPYGNDRGPFGALEGARRVHVVLRRSW